MARSRRISTFHHSGEPMRTALLDRLDMRRVVSLRPHDHKARILRMDRDAVTSAAVQGALAFDARNYGKAIEAYREAAVGLSLLGDAHLEAGRALTAHALFGLAPFRPVEKSPLKQGLLRQALEHLQEADHHYRRDGNQEGQIDALVAQSWAQTLLTPSGRASLTSFAMARLTLYQAFLRARALAAGRSVPVLERGIAARRDVLTRFGVQGWLWRAHGNTVQRPVSSRIIRMQAMFNSGPIF